MSQSFKSASRNLVGAPEGHDAQVVVSGRPGAEVREVAEARAYQLAGQEFVVLAEEAQEAFGRVLGARGVARFGEAVGEEEEGFARLHSEVARSELLVAEDADGQARRLDERGVAAAQEERREAAGVADLERP